MPKGRIVVDEDRCKGCGLCVSACPQQVVRLDTSRLNARGYHPAQLVDPEGHCTGCALCAVICPDTCLQVYRVRAQASPPRAAGASA